MEEYREYNEYEEQPKPDKSIKGYKIVMIILAVILVAVSWLFFTQMRQLRQEKLSLTDQMTALRGEMDTLRTENDTISYNLGVERMRADSLMESLTKERVLSIQKIRRYEKELGTLRTVMRGFVKQIDSLNTLNKQLIAENVDYRKKVSTERLRADMAEEKADELTTKIRKGAVIRARSIALVALSSTDREVTRASRAARLRVDFVLAANELAQPGDRRVYARITGPDGYIMANASNAVFDFEGDKLTYSASREIDYQNQDLPVGLFYNGSGITGGKYHVSIYMDGYQIGSSEVIIR